jgi:hypothetical protein
LNNGSSPGTTIRVSKLGTCSREVARSTAAPLFAAASSRRFRDKKIKNAAETFASTALC